MNSKKSKLGAAFEFPFKRLKISLTPPQALVLGFVAVILIGGILLSLPVSAQPGKQVSFLDALFTATSAVCVTGLVVVDTLTTFSIFGQVVIMLLIQVGGLGFMSMATLIVVLMGRKIRLRDRLLLQEAMNKITIDGVVRLALDILKVTAIFELSGTLVLMLTWQGQMGWGKAAYYGLFHSVSAFNNAGFDLFGNFSSLTGQVSSIPVNLVVGSLIIFGGLGFTVIMELLQFRSRKRFSLHAKIVLVTSLSLLVLGFFAFALLEWKNPGTLGSLPTGSKLLASAFQSVTPRTAGFNTIDISRLGQSTAFMLIILMYIGASPGSTGGGIKTTTVAANLIGIYSLVKGSSDFNVAGRRLSKEQVFRGSAIALIAMSLVTTVAIVIAVNEHLPILSTLFEATSAFGTVGLSLGITPGLSPLGKSIIMFTMFAGRLGPLTLAFALRQTKPQNIRYPEEKIIIG